MRVSHRTIPFNRAVPALTLKSAALIVTRVALAIVTPVASSWSEFPWLSAIRTAPGVWLKVMVCPCGVSRVSVFFA